MNREVIIGLVSAAIGFAIHSLIPVEPKIVTVEKIVEVEKKTTKNKKVDKNTKTTIKPDGTKIVEENLKADTTTNTQTTTKVEEKAVVTSSAPKYSLGVAVEVNSLTKIPSNLLIEGTRNIIGNIDLSLGTRIDYLKPLEYSPNILIGIKLRF